MKRLALVSSWFCSDASLECQIDFPRLMVIPLRYTLSLLVMIIVTVPSAAALEQDRQRRCGKCKLNYAA
ncbi:MAG: hypothetical protein NTX56_17605 [Proteobacteria bacterium]|nr:hypothetical protein [Pseudomonadota bacterium]